MSNESDRRLDDGVDKKKGTSKSDWRKTLKDLRKEIIAAVITIGGPAIAKFAASEGGLQKLGYLLLGAGLISLGYLLWSLYMRTRTEEKLNLEISRLELEIKERKENAIRVIHPDQYVSIIKGLAEKHGPGDLLLFNVELNSFLKRDLLCSVWTEVVKIPEIRSVRLALPPRKFERWVNIVAHENPDFFQKPEIARKFIACKYAPDNRRGEDAIAFVLYNSADHPGVHDWGALFLLNHPFLTEDLEYRHILEYIGNESNLHLLRTALWDRAYVDKWADAVDSVREHLHTMAHGTDLDTFLSRHGCDRNPELVKRVRRIVGSKRVVDRTTHARIPEPRDLSSQDPENGEQYEFRLRYRTDPECPEAPEEIHGYCVGLPNDGTLRPCVIWASGFGDGDQPKLATMVQGSRKAGSSKKGLRNDENDIELGLGESPRIDVFFTKSGEIANTTCSRLTEDIQSVLDYVLEIPGVDPERVCIAGISLCGYLAAKLAAHDGRVRSVLLIGAPKVERVSNSGATILSL